MWEIEENEMSREEVQSDLLIPWKDERRRDLVEVVRCRDCIHHHYEKKNIPYCDRIDYGYGWKDGDFCSHGERRDG